MKLTLKILAFCLVTVISLTIILFSASLIFQDRVAGILLTAINKDLTTRIEIGSARLSFLRKFPRASLHLKNVVVFSSSGFNKDAFRPASADTLLAAEKVSVEFSFSDIIRHNYNISSISVSDGKLNVLTDKLGMINYDIDTGGNESETDEVVINLERVNVSNVGVNYDNRAIDLLIRLDDLQGRFRSRISGSEIELAAQGKMKADTFRLDEFGFPVTFLSEIDIDLLSTDSTTVIKKGLFTLDDQGFNITGVANYDKNYDFRLISKSIDILNFKKYLPAKYLEYLSAYNTTGIINVEAGIKGISSRTATPDIRIDFILSDGAVSIPDSPLALTGLSLTGLFTNRPDPGSDSALLLIRNVSGTFDKEKFKGFLKLTDLDPLTGSVGFEGNIIAADVVKFFRIPHISSATGNVNLKATLNGSLPVNRKPDINDFLGLKRDIALSFSSFGVSIDNKSSVSRVGGSLIISDTTFARDLTLTYLDQTINFSGWFCNLPEWLANDNIQLRSSATISADKLFPESFFNKSASEDSPGSGKAIIFPGDMVLDLNLKINEFRYKAWSAEKVTALLSYKPGLLNISSLSLKSLDGFISGNGLLLQNKDKSIIGKAAIDVKDVDLNSTFRSFKNFGQDFIVADNLSGKVSGKISILIPADSMLNPGIKSITAEGNYVVSEGALKNFEPIKALSSFIEVTELENINFEKLENDFFIKNNFLYIPQMDVKSSVADISVNGKHSFSNDYEYHVKVLLSELLSKKIRKPKPNTTEFGAIQDDGLGRTSLLLKIEDKGDDVKVSYDVKAAGNQIKSSIKSEQRTLKTILNQEYGWFKNDTSSSTTPPASKAPRFKISWEEADSSRVDTEKPAVKKENPIKSIFKKK